MIPDDIKNLTNGELRDELMKLGDLPGPITMTSRNVYELRLLKLRSDPSLAAQQNSKGKFSITGYLSINCVRTNGSTLCPIVWLPYAPEYVDKTSQRGTWLCLCIGICIHKQSHAPL